MASKKGATGASKAKAPVIKKMTVKVQPKTKISKSVRPMNGGDMNPHRGSSENQGGYDIGRTMPDMREGSRHHLAKLAGKLSGVTSDYLAAVADPRDAPLTGVPTEWPLTESFKFRSYVKGTVAIGLQGVGFIQAAPRASMTNNATTVVFSTSAFNLTTTPVTYLEAGVATAAANSPYPIASYGATSVLLQGRVVGAMVRVWYIGTELNLSGEIYAVRQPDNETMNSGFSAAGINSFPGSLRTPVTGKRESVEVFWLPTKASEVEYGVPASPDAYNMSIMITGVAGQLCAYEFYSICEVVGANVPSTTRTPGDPVGLTAAIESAESSNSTYVGTATSLAKTLVKYAGEATQFMTEVTGYSVKDVARATARYMMTGPAMGVREFRRINGSKGLPQLTHLEKYALMGNTPKGMQPETETSFVVNWEDLAPLSARNELEIVCMNPIIVKRAGQQYLLVPLPIDTQVQPGWKTSFREMRSSIKKDIMLRALDVPAKVVHTKYATRAGQFGAHLFVKADASDALSTLR